jgi:hypothetical protein
MGQFVLHIVEITVQFVTKASTLVYMKSRTTNYLILRIFYISFNDHTFSLILLHCRKKHNTITLLYSICNFQDLRIPSFIKWTKDISKI